MSVYYRERNKEIKRMRTQDAKTLEEISKIYGVTRERIRQIVGNTGWFATEMRIKRNREAVQEHPELTNNQLSEIVGVSISTVSELREGQRHKILGNGSLSRGVNAENYVSEILNKEGIEHELMPHQHKFDVQLKNGKTADIKSSYTICEAPSLYKPMYRFHMENRDQADYYICIIMETKDIFIIPATDTPKSATAIAFPYPPTTKTKYEKYHNKFSLLR
jgi:hypothetical protein